MESFIKSKSKISFTYKDTELLNPWALKDLMYIASDGYDLKTNPETHETFAKLSHLLRGKNISPFSEVLFVRNKA